MTIDTQQSISGFIATQPRLTVGENGVSRFHARVGIEHARQEPDGSFTQLEPTFHDLAIFRKTAEEAAARFRKGDRTPRRPSVDRDAPSQDDLGHDAATRAQPTNPTRSSL